MRPQDQGNLSLIFSQTGRWSISHSGSLLQVSQCFRCNKDWRVPRIGDFNVHWTKRVYINAPELSHQRAYNASPSKTAIFFRVKRAWDMVLNGQKVHLKLRYWRGQFARDS